MEPSQNYELIKDLEKMENSVAIGQSKHISPFVHESQISASEERQGLRREDLSLTKNVGPFKEYPHALHQRTGSTNANSYGQSNSSPLRSKLAQGAQTKSHTP